MPYGSSKLTFERTGFNMFVSVHKQTGGSTKLNQSPAPAYMGADHHMNWGFTKQKVRRVVAHGFEL